jgi:hypothetical protein
MALESRELDRERWRGYFDELSRGLGAFTATVEVDGSDIGAQIEAEGLRLTGISYDDRDDVLLIALAGPDTTEGVEHLVSAPRRILLAGEEGQAPSAIDVEDAEGHRTLLQLRAAPGLPAH